MHVARIRGHQRQTFLRTGIGHWSQIICIARYDSARLLARQVHAKTTQGEKMDSE
jgi:hypothetical protein